MKTRAAFSIQAAERDDASAIAALLRAAGLPHEDFVAHLAHFLVARTAPAPRGKDEIVRGRRESLPEGGGGSPSRPGFEQRIALEPRPLGDQRPHLFKLALRQDRPIFPIPPSIPSTPAEKRRDGETLRTDGDSHELGVIVGAIGAEVGGADALLRSLVVAPAHRRAGLGGELVAALERAAARWGVARWWLLTTTAEKFFLAHGFQPMPRSAAPAAIAATREFGGLCPSVAVCLSRGRRIVA